MYPSLSDFGNPGSSSSNPGPARWPPPQLPTSSQNGPSPPPSSTGNQPLLRVHIADQFRTFPPVMINSGLEDIQRTSFAYDFDFERQLIRKHQASGDSDFSTNVLPDPLLKLMERFSPLGFNREDVSLAMTALGGPDNVTDDQVVQLCKNYKELKSMGFDHATIVGALVLHKADLAAATDACLSA